MNRGIIKTKCPACGHVFKTMDVEDNASVSSFPVHCPACGHEFRPARYVAFFDRLMAVLRQER